jgi:hypothetical protein
VKVSGDAEATALQAASVRTSQLMQGLLASGGDLSVLHTGYTEIAQDVEREGYDLSEFLPDEDRADLNFSLPDFGRRFFNKYSEIVRSKLCQEGGELRAHVDKAITSGLGALLAVLASALLVPGAVIVLLAPIAALMLGYGVDAFCEMKEDDGS